MLCNLHCLKSRLGLLRNKISTAQQPEPRHDSLSYVTFLFSEWGIITIEILIIADYHSFSGPNVCLARLQMELCRAEIYLQPANTKSQHFGVSLKFLVCD